MNHTNEETNKTGEKGQMCLYATINRYMNQI